MEACGNDCQETLQRVLMEEGEDVWEDAAAPDVVKYLCKNRHLVIPDGLRKHIVGTTRGTEPTNTASSDAR
jgi:hypothetical protein